MAEPKDQQVSVEKSTQEIIKQQDADISEEKQVEMGKPLKDDSGVDPADQEFLKMLIDKIEKKEIDLHGPSSLINTPVYEKLDEQGQGKADYNAMNLIFTIRQIYNLWQMGDHESFQIQNLVHQMRLTKERLEEISGDIFII